MLVAAVRACVASLILLFSAALSAQLPAPHRFVVAHDRFELDGKPFQIISARRAPTGAIACAWPTPWESTR